MICIQFFDDMTHICMVTAKAVLLWDKKQVTNNINNLLFLKLIAINGIICIKHDTTTF